MCKKEKPQEFFPWRNKSKGTKGVWCKPCNREYDRTRWEKKTSEDKATKTLKANERLDRNRQFLWNYLKENPCPCGETDPVVLEFDHRDGTDKKGNVCEMASRGLALKTVIDEIAKCDVLCANCHRRRTAKQFSWYSRVIK